jgi:hypothetical protein
MFGFWEWVGGVERQMRPRSTAAAWTTTRGAIYWGEPGANAWAIESFDRWSVELPKALAKGLIADLESETEPSSATTVRPRRAFASTARCVEGRSPVSG